MQHRRETRRQAANTDLDRQLTRIQTSGRMSANGLNLIVAVMRGLGDELPGEYFRYLVVR